VSMEQPKETLLYESVFDMGQAEWEAEMREHWLMEGKGITECGNGFLLMRSEIFSVPRHCMTQACAPGRPDSVRGVEHPASQAGSST